MALFGIHPSVLITCTVAGSPDGDHGNSANHLELSGSGFILDPEKGLIATSATWMVSDGLMDLSKPKDHLRHSKSSSGHVLPNSVRDGEPKSPIELGSVKEACWCVFAQEVTHLDQTPGASGEGRGHGVICMEAEFDGVYLMKSVYSGLEEQLMSLAQWRRAPTGPLSDRVRLRATEMGGFLLPLSCVVILQLTQENGYRRSPLLRFPVLKTRVGDTISMFSTPLGSFCPEVFLASLSTGCVSKLLGKDGDVFVTDARCLPGCEGAMVVRGVPKDASRLEVVGMVMAPLFIPEGSPAGLSLVCSTAALLAAAGLTEKATAAPSLAPLPPTLLLDGSASRVSVAITTGGRRGSGMLVSPQMVLTCGHVVKGTKEPISVKLSGAQTYPELNARIVFSAMIPDIALIKLQKPVSNSQTLAAIRDLFTNLSYPQVAAPSSDTTQGSSTTDGVPREINHDFRATTRKSSKTNRKSCESLEGEPIFAVGYGLLEPKARSGTVEPLVTRGVVSKVVRWEARQEVMLGTTAVVHPGMSGGMIVSAATGEVIGMVISNSEDKETGAVYPDVNYCLPASWVLPPVLRFAATGDFSQLAVLYSCPQGVKEVWKLSTRLSGLHQLPSKL